MWPEHTARERVLALRTMGRPCKFRHEDKKKEGDQSNAAELTQQSPAEVANIVKSELLKLLQSRVVPKEAQGHAMSVGDDSLAHEEAQGHAAMSIGDDSLAGVLSLVHGLPEGFWGILMAASCSEG